MSSCSNRRRVRVSSMAARSIRRSAPAKARPKSDCAIPTALALCVKSHIGHLLTVVVYCGKQARDIRQHKLLRHADMGQDKDVPQILLWLKQAGQMLLSIIKDHDLIADVLLEEEDL